MASVCQTLQSSKLPASNMHAPVQRTLMYTCYTDHIAFKVNPRDRSISHQNGTHTSLTLFHQQNAHSDQQSPVQRICHVSRCCGRVFSWTKCAMSEITLPLWKSRKSVVVCKWSRVLGASILLYSVHQRTLDKDPPSARYWFVCVWVADRRGADVCCSWAPLLFTQFNHRQLLLSHSRTRPPLPCLPTRSMPAGKLDLYLSQIELYFLVKIREKIICSVESKRYNVIAAIVVKHLHIDCPQRLVLWSNSHGHLSYHCLTNSQADGLIQMNTTKQLKDLWRMNSWMYLVCLTRNKRLLT